MAEALTMNLRMEIDKTNLLFNRWISTKKDCIDLNDSHYNHKMEENNVTINALRENYLQLESSKSVNESIKRQQQQEIDQCVAQNNLLLKQKEVLEQQLRKCEEDEEKEIRRLDEARAEHEVLRSRMEQTLNDLIYGMRHYTALGLEFQKAEGDCMKFIFSQIDEQNPNAKFYFVMFVDTQNLYQLVETNPVLNEQQCSEHIKALNRDNDIGKFVLQIRKMFQMTTLKLI